MLCSILPFLLKIFFICAFFFFIVVFIIYLLKFNFKERNIIQKIYLTSTALLAVSFLAFAFYAPNYISAQLSLTKDLDSSTIYNLMSPFIAIAAAILTFMAFWTQYQANDKMLKKDEKQEVEHQFFEMLHIHKENVNELTWEQWRILESPNSNPYTTDSQNKYGYHHISGHQVFEFHATEFYFIERCLLLAIDEVKKRSHLLHCNINFSEHNLENMIDVATLSYYIYMKGLQHFGNLFKNESKTKEYFEKFDNAISETLKNNGKMDFISFEKTIPECREHLFNDENGFILVHLYFNLKKCKHNAKSFIFDLNELDRSVPTGTDLFTGHFNKLNHYYRHLYQMVKIVANYDEKILSYKEKRKFLKMLRAQLTSYEQALLFYNWLSGFGSDWENDKNHFFTTFRMIHNINPEWMIIFNNIGHEKIIKMIKDSNPNYNEYDNDNLFEFEDRLN